MNDSAPRTLFAVVNGDDDALSRAVRRALEADGVTVRRAGPDRPPALDILIHIAGDAPPDFSEGRAGAFADTLARTLKSAFLALQDGVAAIRAGAAGGSVVLVAPPTMGRAHDALRQGLRLLTKSAALELGAEDIRVNIILPGSQDDSLGRPVNPDDIAASVAFAASARARFMTGADLVVDGGASAR